MCRSDPLKTYVAELSQPDRYGIILFPALRSSGQIDMFSRVRAVVVQFFRSVAVPDVAPVLAADGEIPVLPADKDRFFFRRRRVFYERHEAAAMDSSDKL